ncbi:hypothetical protein [Pseudoxanthomonas suwonensis]|uniref:hypothetical protein n=1 Tax=Pseudoxanthomonas suwonensis TaxID=314722 RepID=UPI001184F3F9|nr:hypothetical protein [Pseudoxanthomonas suwonensis]
MIDVLSTMHALLQESKFEARLIALDDDSILCFEDESVMGFCKVFDSPQSLLSNWRTAELGILRRFAANFREAPDKAWNVYTVFLCTQEASPDESRQIRWIEEDLERTRKITGCGVVSREDLVNALLAILPIQYEPKLQTEDSTARLTRQIRGISAKAADVVLDSAVSPSEVVRLMSATS